VAINRRTMPAPPDAVLAVLSDATAYPRWVVGPREAVAVDAAWPDPGSGFVHETGRGPLRFRDRTTVVSYEPDRGHIVLEAHSGPLGTALVSVRVTPADGGSAVVLEEDAVSGPLRLLPVPLRDAAIKTRNRAALRRLRRMVRTGTRSP
jgi:uncharacterized protein YndB with AHSA1/START domain